MAQIVGIFSRSGETDYAWLTDRLGEHCEVLTVCITNNNRNELILRSNQCQWVILYHTKHRGRVNITDVTDSLYDSEIDLLSDRHGKSHVLVVIDDLEDSSEEVKQRILSSQPTLGTKAHNIFLFTKPEKLNEQILKEKIQPIIDVIQRGKEESREIVLILGVTALSATVIRETIRSPDGRNLLLASLWSAGAIRTFYKKPSKRFWFTPRIHSTLSWTVTLASFINTYYRPTASNASLSFSWLIASVILPRNQFNLNRTALKTMGYSLVIYSFWKGWKMPNTTKVWEMIVQTVLRSPSILAAL
ncbi:uncharacterized protein LOC120942927 [Rana temporaria]|uniref:uncharacterized protein LOC120942927 n=1 Tax=Rana temporaria TaxID=8407 RepID=UPI001AADFF27|nr:uncharacterized protein LOC120942927 [Rana temporaria]XP_040211824.1 uncharacterized protein LOC120942927 [Rana temporaria]XP_040211825.1 uncharacterized protein LOC120942927 [Rana temporaria]